MKSSYITTSELLSNQGEGKPNYIIFPTKKEEKTSYSSITSSRGRDSRF